MIARLVDTIVRWLKRLFPPQAELDNRGGGPCLDRELAKQHAPSSPRSIPGKATRQ